MPVLLWSCWDHTSTQKQHAGQPASQAGPSLQNKPYTGDHAGFFFSREGHAFIKENSGQF